MRLTVQLRAGKWTNRKHYECLWENKSKKQVPQCLPYVLKQQGQDVKISDAAQLKHPFPKKVFVPPKDDMRFWTRPTVQEEPNYKKEQVLTYNKSMPLWAGTKQAQCLTKSLAFDGLPASVENLVDKVTLPDQDKLIQRSIMHSQIWDTTMEKLPKRIDRENVGWKFQTAYGIPSNKSVKILTDDLVRLCHNAICSKYMSALLDRRMIYRPGLHTNYKFKEFKINVKSSFEYLMTSQSPLSAFTNTNHILTSVDETLPSLYPVLPTIDLRADNTYNLDNNIGFQPGYEFSHPHTFVSCTGDTRLELQHAEDMMFCFSYTMAQAKIKYGENVKKLPEPICVQCVSINETEINLTCFQLNTLDLATEDGVKNFAWLDFGNKLFDKHLSKPWKGRQKEFRITKRDGYRSLPFRKMMAVMLNGVSLEQ